MRRLKPIHILSVFVTTLLVAGCQGAANSHSAAGPNDAPSAAPAEEFRELTIPAATTITVALDDGVGSETSRVDDPVRAHVTRPVSIDGVVVVPMGSNVSGAVVEAVRSGRVEGARARRDSIRQAPAGRGWGNLHNPHARSVPHRAEREEKGRREDRDRRRGRSGDRRSRGRRQRRSDRRRCGRRRRHGVCDVDARPGNQHRQRRHARCQADGADQIRVSTSSNTVAAARTN